MTAFFGIFAALCSVALVSTAVLGYVDSSYHLMGGLLAAVMSISCHCLIFAIFTGSGKDTRLLVEDWKLDTNYVKRTKIFKRTVFPPALYAILFLLMVTTLGGAISKFGYWARTIHGLMALFTIYYNLKTFLKEYAAVKENAGILAEVNRVAGAVTSGVEEPETNLEWGTHVFALGKFLCFLGWNVWLVYLYVRIIMGLIQTPLWPFLLSSVVLLGAGYYLRLSYRSFRPQH